MTTLSAIQIQAMVRDMDESFRKYRNLKESNPTLWAEKMKNDNKRLFDEFPTVFNMHMNGKLDQTFFEMLGNFSIGDYFSKEAIEWGWEILTDEKYYGFEKDKLYITVYPTDTETWNHWLSVGVEESHLIKCEHNFWEIGSGPCGPDTEIFYDRKKSRSRF